MAAPRRALAQTLLRAPAHIAGRRAAAAAATVRPCLAQSVRGSAFGSLRGVPLHRAAGLGVRWLSSYEYDADVRRCVYDEVKEQATSSPSSKVIVVGTVLPHSPPKYNDVAANFSAFSRNADVREPEELFETGKIPGAVNIPITSAVQSFHISDADFEDMYGYARPAKDAPLLFYCKAGVRALAAARLARDAGWGEVSYYEGSWNDWHKNQGPVEPVKGGRGQT